jgi:hypothetical protein
MALLPPPVQSHATKEELKESLRLWKAENWLRHDRQAIR